MRMARKRDEPETRVSFSGEVIKEIWKSDTFKVYGVLVNAVKFPDIKQNDFGNVSISGDIQDLVIGATYDFVGIEQTTKNGIGYKLENVKRETPKGDSILIFLKEILTEKQAEELYRVYPNIIDIIKENKYDTLNYKKLHGIGEIHLERIKNKIIENFCLSDIITMFNGCLSISVVKKLYDKYADVLVIEEKLRKSPYDCLCNLGGVGFKTADSILLNLEEKLKKDGLKSIIRFDDDLRTSLQRCISCVSYLLKKNEESGNTKMNLVDLRKQVLETTPECIDKFPTAIQDKRIWYDKKTLDIALDSTYKKELKISDFIHTMVQSDSSWGIDKDNFEVECYRKSGDIELTDEQLSLLHNVIKYNICTLVGNAGSGKTSAVQSVIKMLQDNHKLFQLLTPTGKASRVLSKYTKCAASTIHRGLLYNPSDGWGYNENCKLPYDIIIVDEFSMVDISLFCRLIDAIDCSKTKILLIGDDAQLPSVGCGNILHDILSSNLVPTVKLTKIFRYTSGGLMKVATDIRNCSPYLDNKNKGKLIPFGEDKDYVFISSNEDDIISDTISLYRKLLQSYNVEDIQILTAKNVGKYGTEKLNFAVQKVANKNYGSSNNMIVGNTTYYIGDLIIQKANNYKAKIYDEIDSDNDSGKSETAFVANGEHGIIKKIDRNYVVIDFDGVMIAYKKSELNCIGLGYVITTHRSQGSQANIVIVVTPKADSFVLNSNLLYVGVTRAKKTCYHVGNAYAINRAIQKKEDWSRNTFLYKFLS